MLVFNIFSFACKVRLKSFEIIWIGCFLSFGYSIFILFIFSGKLTVCSICISCSFLSILLDIMIVVIKKKVTRPRFSAFFKFCLIFGSLDFKCSEILINMVEKRQVDII